MMEKEVLIWKDWQEEKDLLGIASIIEEVPRSTYTFITDTIDIPESLTPVYSFKSYRVKFLYKTKLGESQIHEETPIVKVRHLDHIGLKRSKVKEDVDPTSSLPVDKFIKVNGIEIY